MLNVHLLEFFDPVKTKAIIPTNKDLSSSDGNQMTTVAMSDPQRLLSLSMASNVRNRKAHVHMLMEVGVPVSHEVCQVFDVHPRAGDLPLSLMGGTAAVTGLACVTRLFEEPAP